MLNSKFDTIFCPPVNSSGDVYHIAAYLICCRALDKIVPTVILFSDTSDTKDQANRSKNFLAALGFTNARVEEFTSTCYQAKSRLKKSIDEVRRFSTKAVDQKTTTSLLSYLIMLYGNFIQDSIFQHIQDLAFKPRAKAYPAYYWANLQVTLAIKKLNIINTPFVIINARSSNKTNSEQDLTYPQLSTIASTLKQLNIHMLILDIGGNTGRQFSAKNNPAHAKSIAIDVFEAVTDLRPNHEKLPHVFLLQQLSKFKTCIGVIGNTSGTLDIAAFMGIKTLCIHRFKKDSQSRIIIPYQDLRILLQANLMSIYDYNLRLKGLAKFLVLWLNYDQHSLCHQEYGPNNIRLEDKQFSCEHYERKCFALDPDGKIANPSFLKQFSYIRLNQALNTIENRSITNDNAVATTKDTKPKNLRPKHEAQDDNYNSPKPRFRARKLSI